MKRVGSKIYKEINKHIKSRLITKTPLIISDRVWNKIVGGYSDRVPYEFLYNEENLTTNTISKFNKT